MISLGYVNDTYSFNMDLLCRPFESYLESCMDDVNLALAEYNMEVARCNIFYDVFGEAAPEKD